MHPSGQGNRVSRRIYAQNFGNRVKHPLTSTTTPFGALLTERGISSRAVGEAVAIAERKSERLPTELINRWVRGTCRPSKRRRRLLADLFDVDVDDIFPALPEERPDQELELLARASSAETPAAPLDPAADFLKRTGAQSKLRDLPGDNTGKGSPLHVMSTRRKGGKAGRRKPRRPAKREKVAV